MKKNTGPPNAVAKGSRNEKVFLAKGLIRDSHTSDGKLSERTLDNTKFSESNFTEGESAADVKSATTLNKRRIWSGRKKTKNPELGNSINIETDTTMMSNRTIEEPPNESLRFERREIDLDVINSSRSSAEGEKAKRKYKKSETLKSSEYHKEVVKSLNREMKDTYITNGPSNESNFHNHMCLLNLSKQLKTFLHNKLSLSTAASTKWRSGSAKHHIAKLRPAFTPEESEGFQEILKINPCPRLARRGNANKNELDAGEYFSLIEKDHPSTNTKSILNSTVCELDQQEPAFGIKFGDYKSIIKLGNIHGKTNSKDFRENLSIGWDAYKTVKYWKRPSSAPAGQKKREFEPLYYDEFYDEVYQTKPKAIYPSKIILKGSRRAGVLVPEESIVKVSNVKSRAEVLEDQLKKKKQAFIQCSILKEAIEDDMEFYSQRMKKMLVKSIRDTK